METWKFVILAIVAYVLYKNLVVPFIGGLKSTDSNVEMPPAAAPLSSPSNKPPPPVNMSGDTDEVEIKGESFYQDALIALFGPYTAKGSRSECTAALVREPTNRHDKNALRCEISGHLVGYVNKDDAQTITEYMKKRKIDSLTVNASVNGGYLRTGKKPGMYGVTVELDAAIME